MWISHALLPVLLPCCHCSLSLSSPPPTTSPLTSLSLRPSRPSRPLFLSWSLPFLFIFLLPLSCSHSCSAVPPPTPPYPYTIRTRCIALQFCILTVATNCGNCKFTGAHESVYDGFPGLSVWSWLECCMRQAVHCRALQYGWEGVLIWLEPSLIFKGKAAEKNKKKNGNWGVPPEIMSKRDQYKWKVAPKEASEFKHLQVVLSREHSSLICLPWWVEILLQWAEYASNDRVASYHSMS